MKTNSTKKITLTLGIVALGLAVIFGGIWLFGSFPAIVSGQQLRTEQQVQDAYHKGFNEGLANYSELLEQIDQYTKTITSLYDLTDRLRARVAELEPLTDEVERLNWQIKNLEADIKYYEDFVFSVEVEGRAVVIFEYDGHIHDIVIVNSGSTAATKDPVYANSIFNSWTVDGQVIDLNSYHFTKNTRVVADISHIYTVNFVTNWKTEVIDGKEITEFGFYSVRVIEGGIATPSTVIWDDFVGWTTVWGDKSTLVDLTATSIKKDITFYPYLKSFDNSTSTLPSEDADPGKFFSTMRRAA